MRLAFLFPVILLALTACGPGSPRPAASSGPTQNPDCMTHGGEVVTEAQGVRARDGECLTSRAIAVGPEQAGAASPENAVLAAGFGRGTLTVEPDDVPTHVSVTEREGDRVVGRYSVVRIGREWIVDGYLVSIPNAV